MSEEYAFPNISTEKDESGFPVATTEQQGMTLRDWFAGMAMQGMMHGLEEPSEAYIAKHSYLVADAMMDERG